MLKILLLDIETAPNVVYTWGLYNQNIAINQIDRPGYTLCWSAKWLGDDTVHFSSIRKGKDAMLNRIHRMLGEADVVVTYNGKKFDIPTLNREFILNGLPPPAPYKHIDLYQVVKSTFRFVSNKLDWICRQLEIGSQMEHKGHELWVGCMSGDKDDWKVMEAYNRQDVKLLEDAYLVIRPWIYSHPSYAAVSGDVRCPKCGGYHLQRRGHTITAVHKYPRYQCQDCGGWARGNKTLLPRVPERVVNVAV